MSYLKKIAILMLIAMTVCASSIFAGDNSTAEGMVNEQDTAKITGIIGEAKYLKKGQADWQVLEKDMKLEEGDSIRTAIDSIVTLELFGSAKTADLVVKPESEFTLNIFSHDAAKKMDKTLLDIQAGSVLVKAQKLVGDSTFQVKTPTSIVGIRGTTFEVQVEKS